MKIIPVLSIVAALALSGCATTNPNSMTNAQLYNCATDTGLSTLTKNTGQCEQVLRARYARGQVSKMDVSIARQKEANRQQLQNRAAALAVASEYSDY